MNNPLRSELERLKERQTHLHHAVDLLGMQIGALEKRVVEVEEEQSQLVEAESGGTERRASGPVPPPLPFMAKDVSSVTLPKSQPVSAAAIGGLTTSAATVAQTAIPEPPPVMPPAAFIPVRRAVPAKPESFEMRLGTYWLVRIGIVAMLTALVFFGTYAYQNYIGMIGPAGKVSLLYLASGILLGFGAWFQRRAASASLQGYAQVLFAGGLASVYFTTYAAHHFPNLQVIANATLDGALLLVWAGFMVWMADRRKSEVLAMFAIGLAYYTSVITRAGHFTLYSNLVLAAAALFFLVRNRWANLSFGCLIATYAGYGFWRFWQDGGWHWADPGAGLWTGVYFLAGYWTIFTAAVFLSRHREFAGVNRASFATLNNAAFFALFLLTMLQVHSGGFWRFCLVYGGVLLGAAALGKVRLREEPLAANTYLTQGLLLVTAGLLAKFSGLQLALVLGLESVVLWLTGTLRQNIIMRTGACVSAALAVLWAFDGIDRDDPHGAWLGAGVGAFLAFNAFWSHWRVERAAPRLMRISPTYFSALALLTWSFALWQNVARINCPLAFALGALVLALSVHLTRLRELGFLGQLLLPVSALLFIANQTVGLQPEPWWIFAVVGAVALALVHWWQKQTVVECPHELRVAGQVVPALILVGATGYWLPPRLDMAQWVWTSSLLALVLTAYGAVMRNWVLALVAQVFTAMAVVNFVLHSGNGIILPWLPALAPLASLTLLALAGGRWAVTWAGESEVARGMRQIPVWYGRLAMALLVWWTFQYAGSQELVWGFTVLGAAAFAVAGWRRNTEFLVFAGVLNFCALTSLVFQLESGTAVYWPNFLAVLVWMGEQQLARRTSERYPVGDKAHNIAIIGAGVALWILSSRWVMQGFSGFYLTASWSVFAFAVLALGIILRERMYRWVGLGVLGFALGRVAIFDVWKLETLYRILSFFALGVVLLVLGFIYNRYQERLRQWL